MGRENCNPHSDTTMAHATLPSAGGFATLLPRRPPAFQIAVDRLTPHRCERSHAMSRSDSRRAGGCVAHKSPKPPYRVTDYGSRVTSALHPQPCLNPARATVAKPARQITCSSVETCSQPWSSDSLTCRQSKLIPASASGALSRGKNCCTAVRLSRRFAPLLPSKLQVTAHRCHGARRSAFLPLP